LEKDELKYAYSLTKLEVGDWQLKQVSKSEILQVFESLPQYLAPHCGHPTTLPPIGLRHCQQIAAGLLTCAIGTVALGACDNLGRGKGSGVVCKGGTGFTS